MTTASTISVPEFRTPPRILIPKLLRSRDAWKLKATQRKAQRKALQIRVRDLAASRDRHRRHAQHLQDQLDQLQLRLEHAQQRDQLHRRPDARAAPSSPARLPPKTTPTPSAPAAGTTPSP